METIHLSQSVTDSIDIAKTAFEKMKGIETYHQQGNSVVGKTGPGIKSYGEAVLVNCQQSNEEGYLSVMTISGEREVSTNITSNPDKYVHQFVSNVYDLKDKTMEDILTIAGREMSEGGSKEVTQASQQASGSGFMIVMVVATLVIFLFMLSSI